jgi:ABC-type antimicrobial peptide transport system permease subunit
VVRLLTGTRLRLVGPGTAVGLGLALLAGRLMSGLLNGVESMDPVAFLAAPLVLVAVAVLAAWLPARRASRVSPVRSLKAD